MVLSYYSSPSDTLTAASMTLAKAFGISFSVSRSPRARPMMTPLFP